VSEFLATSDGLALTKAFMRIKDAKLRRSIVNLIVEIAEMTASQNPGSVKRRTISRGMSGAGA